MGDGRERGEGEGEGEGEGDGVFLSVVFGRRSEVKRYNKE